MNNDNQQNNKQATEVVDPHASHDRIASARNSLSERILSKKYANGAGGGISIKPKAEFANQNEGEMIYVLVRKHWYNNLGWIFRNIVYALLPFFILTVLAGFGLDLLLTNARLIGLVMIVYYSFIFTNVIKLFTDWYFDPFFVTTDRVMDYNFKPYGRYAIGEVSLENIVDVKQKSAGFIGDVFNYGTVEIRTENNTRNIIMEDIPNPTLVRDVITDLYKIAKSYPYGDT